MIDPKQSPSYRADDFKLSAKIIEEIDAYFLPTLDKFNYPNPKVLVVFSGGVAVGKSTLSSKIARELNGLVIETDAIKKCIQSNIDSNLDSRTLGKYSWAYSMDLYSRICKISPNGLVVRDSVIDWYFDRIIPKFKIQGFELFVVNFDVSKKKREELIRARGEDKPTTTIDRMVEMIDENLYHQSRFLNAYQPNVTLGEDNLFDHEIVIDNLRAKIDSLV
ncbi:TPA: hypothetical protein EYO12_04160 [Candidatus Saccharibacteria bacterium]|nr:hypothetical protein [Candidatus Saccharibacteria bacterium]HIO87771.1 hypothetical protein [Candidatus Saccharibacteria bacterium]